MDEDYHDKRYTIFSIFKEYQSANIRIRLVDSPHKEVLNYVLFIEYLIKSYHKFHFHHYLIYKWLPHIL